VSELLNHPDLEVLFTAWLPSPWTPTGGVRWVHVAGAGVEDARDTPLWQDSTILFTNSSGVHAAAISQWVTAMILHHTHRLRDVLGLAAAQDWSNREARAGRLLVGKTLAILGYGSIGTECARLGRALGMRVLAMRQTSLESKDAPRTRWTPRELGERADADGRIGFAELDTLLREADYLVITAPLTDATRGLIGTREIGLMKPSACLINVSRGAIVDEAALAIALHEGRLSGAALDVFVDEPLPSDSPLFAAPNVEASAHMSGMFDTFWDLAVECFRANLQRYVAGQPLLNVVDREQGY
jgi:phosphoglycerate dehydrogenase-like enzyme